MNRAFSLALVLAGSLAAAPWLAGQAANGSSPAPSSAQSKQPAGSQKPAPPPSGSNPFPEDTSSVPVLPTTVPSDIPGDAEGRLSLPPDDLDPVRTPDDAANAANGNDANSSSSLANIDSLLPGPDTDQPGKKGKGGEQVVPEHHETAAEDINVGKYYLDQKNWKAALSRFQSAMVLSPDDPEVYWGIAESDRHLGNFADARANYLKVMDYDPDSRHAKEAGKLLKDPEIANAKAAPPSPPVSKTSQ